MRRAYLHEKQRAEAAIERLRAYDELGASIVEGHAYKGRT